jgi:ribosomal protein S18 acetylase RimI-like enzyme
MYSCISLNRKDVQQLLELNKRRKEFNVLNENFEEYYNYVSLIKKLLIHRKVKLLKHNNKVIGYIWLSRQNKNSFYIDSMYVKGEDYLIERYGLLIDSIRSRSKLIYNCESNEINKNILSQLGFIKKEGTYEMHAKITIPEALYESNDIVFEQFQKGKHEEIRCKIQNEVFKNDTRIPLTKDDMYYDQLQSYYYEKGSILLKKGNVYIGYGQIIFNDDIPTIVNVGLVEGYRGKGYGRVLMYYLLKVLAEEGREEVNLKVSTSNHSALKLYKSLGFIVKNETNLWEYKK